MSDGPKKEYATFEFWREEYDRTCLSEFDELDEFSTDEDLRAQYEAGDSPLDAATKNHDEDL